MRLVIAALLFGMSLLLVPAQAASFSCEAAETPVEKSICSDETLSAMDSTLALAFAHAMAGLTEEAGIVARQGQSDWLNYIDTVCADENLRRGTVPEFERPICLRQLYLERLAILEQNRLVHGYRFYTVDRYAALANDNPEFKVARKVTSSLRIDGFDAFALAFNAAAAEITTAYSGKYKDFAGKAADDTKAQQDNAVLMRIVAHNDALLSVRLDTARYNHGAEYDTSFGMFHFWFDEARPLEASDLFEQQGWQETLAVLIAERIAPDILYAPAVDAADVAFAVDDPLQWSFTDAGMMVEFEPGQIEPAGSPAVVVPWSVLVDVMTFRGADISIWN
ncbi:lysozyme inhibitor LprI family protein [Devosia sp. SL43]|uniref:lysozyme inhibitor LprI family protein n=1 Tax=Devosia sp. SL43 TaxID=2806348 RepID=UPI001F2841BB|nr:lysozyme inhibitor LprI family protein [Devosia sp. SL43]UJW83892.1 hypothetical protein IM737_10420 [Devosia sp. SL43]